MATANEQSTVVRTSRGLTVAGTRLTLYTILDHLHAGWSPSLIQQWFQLSDTQMADILNYIETNRAEVHAEYQQVVAQAEANRQYWETRNRERTVSRDPATLSPEQRAIWEKLQAWKLAIQHP